MRCVDLIIKKRDGGELSPDEIAWLVRTYTEGGVGNEQMSAFAMAVFFRGMSGAELAAMTEAMMRSGNVIDLSSLPGKKVDKHSTGGVGDKVSICLAPLVAACGVPVPMISGRGLGHTGGTLDKLSAIPGFSVDLDDAGFVEVVKKHGLALIGQTATLAPADKKLYALRDVTGTVESIPLISASILSKKLAEGIDGLVLDVKVGSGAFMRTMDRARALAKTMVAVGERMGRRVRALITGMDQVLGRAVGNANETWEAIEVLRGGGPADLVEITVELGAEMLVLGEVADSLDDGRTRIRRAISDGRGLERLRRCVEAQHGDPDSIDRREALPMAAQESVIRAVTSGYVRSMDTASIGRAAMILGAGRARIDDVIDLGVGIDMLARLGHKVEVGEPIAKLAYNDEPKARRAEREILKAIEIGDEPPEALPLVRDRIGTLRNGSDEGKIDR
ncbi:MAG: thymidine phosphorylase [Deltaproteobacteria bacterium]|nr:thymidine phosphorylase [Deltaproteobacteria bacterium]